MPRKNRKRFKNQKHGSYTPTAAKIIDDSIRSFVPSDQAVPSCFLDVFPLQVWLAQTGDQLSIDCVVDLAISEIQQNSLYIVPSCIDVHSVE